MIKPVVYTIGHSTHSIEFFLELLRTYAINCVVDVRSVPASSYNPQFNKAGLANFLKMNCVNYLHFPEEFGARHSAPDLLDENGKVDFEKVRSSTSFSRGLERLKQGLEKGFTIALMCSESDAFDCHRFSMISVALEKEGFEVAHITKDKTSKSNMELEAALLKKYDKKIPKPDIFNPDVSVADQLKVAYRLRNRDIAYSPNSEAEERNDD